MSEEPDHDDSTNLKELSNAELKQEAIHTTSTFNEQPNTIAMPKWLVASIFLGTACIIVLGLFNTYLRWDQANRLEMDNLALNLHVKDLEAELRLMEVEREREAQLVRITASQEAEGSALTKLARKDSRNRDKVDQIKAQTRRYLLLNANFQASTKGPADIVEELCNLYKETTGEGCY